MFEIWKADYTDTRDVSCVIGNSIGYCTKQGLVEWLKTAAQNPRITISRVYCIRREHRWEDYRTEDFTVQELLEE